MRTATRIAALCIGLAAASWAQEAPGWIDNEPTLLRVRAESHVVGAQVRLGDVLELDGASAEIAAAIRDVVLRGPLDTAGSVQIGFEEIAERLEQRGVNMARVVLTGALQSVVHVIPDPETAPEAAPEARSTSATRESGPRTLADEIVAVVQREFEETGGAVHIDFERAADEYTALGAPFEFRVRPAQSGKLGLREFRVRILRDGREQRSVTLFGRVRLEREVLVAARPLNMGTYIRPDGVTRAVRIFDNADELGVVDLDKIVGQRIDRFVDVGEMLRGGDVRAVELVQRGRPVTVISDGSVAVRVNGTALDNGNFGDSVRIRLGAAGRETRVIRGTVSGMATVRMTEGR